MLEFDNIRLDLESFEEPLAKLKDALHIDRVTDQISELENRTTEPDFWNDPAKAQELTQTLGRLKKKVENYNNLVSEREDLLALCELANEEDSARRLFADDIKERAVSVEDNLIEFTPCICFDTGHGCRLGAFFIKYYLRHLFHLVDEYGPIAEIREFGIIVVERRGHSQSHHDGLQVDIGIGLEAWQF